MRRLQPKGFAAAVHYQGKPLTCYCGKHDVESFYSLCGLSLLVKDGILSLRATLDKRKVTCPVCLLRLKIGAHKETDSFPQRRLAQTRTSGKERMANKKAK